MRFYQDTTRRASISSRLGHRKPPNLSTRGYRFETCLRRSPKWAILELKFETSPPGGTRRDGSRTQVQVGGSALRVRARLKGYAYDQSAAGPRSSLGMPGRARYTNEMEETSTIGYPGFSSSRSKY